MNSLSHPLTFCVALVVFFSSSISFAYASAAATTTTLTISFGGNPVTTVSWGPVMLSAAVSRAERPTPCGGRF